MATVSRRGDTSAGSERQRDAERTRREILEGAIGEIAARTSTTKRMIYYYFGGKEQLYIAALEQAYATARAAEQMDVDHLDPVSAVRTLAEPPFDHHESHPDFVSLVAVENIHHGEFIAKSAAIAALNSPAVSVIASILERGYASGAFTRRAEAIDIHLMISSFCFFRMSNRYSFGAIFGVDLLDADRREHYRQMAGALVVSYL